MTYSGYTPPRWAHTHTHPPVFHSHIFSVNGCYLVCVCVQSVESASISRGRRSAAAGVDWRKQTLAGGSTEKPQHVSLQGLMLAFSQGKCVTYFWRTSGGLRGWNCGGSENRHQLSPLNTHAYSSVFLMQWMSCSVSHAVFLSITHSPLFPNLRSASSSGGLVQLSLDDNNQIKVHHYWSSVNKHTYRRL